MGRGLLTTPPPPVPVLVNMSDRHFLFLAHQTDPLFNLKYFMIVKFINFLFNYLDDTECVLYIIYLVVVLSLLYVLSYLCRLKACFYYADKLWEVLFWDNNYSNPIWSNPELSTKLRIFSLRVLSPTLLLSSQKLQNVSNVCYNVEIRDSCVQLWWTFGIHG